MSGGELILYTAEDGSVRFTITAEGVRAEPFRKRVAE